MHGSGRGQFVVGTAMIFDSNEDCFARDLMYGGSLDFKVG